MIHFNKACYCAIGANVTVSGRRSANANDERVITDGSWYDNYTHNDPAELADVFCTNNENDGISERWIQLDLENSYVVCAVDIYNRIGKLLGKWKYYTTM